MRLRSKAMLAAVAASCTLAYPSAASANPQADAMDTLEYAVLSTIVSLCPVQEPTRTACIQNMRDRFNNVFPGVRFLDLVNIWNDNFITVGAEIDDNNPGEVPDANPLCAIDGSVDADGRLIIPSAPLSGGAPLPKEVTRSYTMNPSSSHNTGDMLYWNTYNPDARILWFLHQWNLNNAQSDQRSWQGVFSMGNGGEGNITFEARSIAYYDLGQKIESTYRYHGTMSNNFWNRTTSGNANYPCPSTDGSSGDFHFYAYGSGLTNAASCRWYAPNYHISPSGYYYGPQTAVDFDEIYDPATNQPWLENCVISKGAIADLVNEVGSTVPEWPGAADDEVVGNPPFREFTEPMEPLPEGEPDGTPNTPDPDPDPDPADPSDPTDPPDPSPTGDPVTPPADDPEDVELEFWIPELPELNLGVNQTCPTYSFDAFDQTHVFDQHCPFIESNRALIATIMLIVFSLAGMMIVLRA